MNDKERADTFEHNLVVVRGYGIHHLHLIECTVYLLEASKNGEIELDAEAVNKLFTICKNNINAYKKLLKMSIDEKLDYP
ncbi:MAG: hypothetical protein AAFV93_06595 [Chloroflexota bacterium]